MPTEAQILANHPNAQKSTGPRTPWGKAAVSHNAVKHALLARQAVISSATNYEQRTMNNEERIIMQNKPNLLHTQMNISSALTKDYESETAFRLRENKPNSNPNKPNFRKAKMNINSLITKDYRKNDALGVQKNKPNSNPISSKTRINANFLPTKGYENQTAFGLHENKPSQTQFQPQNQAFLTAKFIFSAKTTNSIKFTYTRRNLGTPYLFFSFPDTVSYLFL